MVVLPCAQALEELCPNSHRSQAFCNMSDVLAGMVMIYTDMAKSFAGIN